MRSRKQYEVEHRLAMAEAGIRYSLDVFGDELARREAYRDGHLTGLDAVRYYLMQKHHWLPAQVRSMSHEDLRFALTEEMHGWTLPKEALPPRES